MSKYWVATSPSGRVVIYIPKGLFARFREWQIEVDRDVLAGGKGVDALGDAILETAFRISTIPSLDVPARELEQLAKDL